MSAVPLVTLNDVLDNFIFVAAFSPTLTGFIEDVEAYQVSHSSELTLPLDQIDKNLVLKRLTGFIVSTGTDMNCYPVGLTDTMCFDLDGNPVP